ncbi:MAG: extracellular solute-binding protein [Candidatus Omnitrophica bacterium]|nr:extracellular solute-binding protein [Candidatus Omnitrophota bacterium]
MKLLMRFCLLGITSLSILFLSGCGNNAPASSKKCSKQVITVWHWMTDREPAFKELSKKYEEKTGIKVNFELYAPSDQYSQKVRAAAQGQTLPDIFGALGEKRDFASLIKSGQVLNLESYMNDGFGAWKNKFFAKALAVNEFSSDDVYKVPAGIYGVPIDITTIQIVYNKKLLKKLGIDPNRPVLDFQGFLDVGKKIKTLGVQGLVSGWGEIWMIDCFANNYAFNIMGRDKVLATIKGKVSYTDPDWIKVLTIFKEMKEAGILTDGVVTMVNKTAEQLFANEKSVFAFNGSWCANVYNGMNPNLDYGVMLPPKVSDKFPMAIWGGAGSSFVVNARSENKEEAIKFLKWLTDKEQQAYLAKKTNNLPANKDCLDSIPPILAQFADDMEYATHPNVWGVSEFPVVIEAWDKGIQSIIIGEKTPEQVATEVQRIKERELAKKKK